MTIFLSVGLPSGAPRRQYIAKQTAINTRQNELKCIDVGLRKTVKAFEKNIAGVEATMCRLKYQMKMPNLRVRGMKMIRYVSYMRAIGLNIRRCTRTRQVSLAK